MFNIKKSMVAILVLLCFALNSVSAFAQSETIKDTKESAINQKNIFEKNLLIL